jgi:hypothetical protein
VAASSPDPSVGEEGLQADLDTNVGADASSLDPKAARILSEVVPSYSEKHVTQKRLSHACLIIEILA